MGFDERLQSESLDRLFKAIMTLDSIEEYYRFFEDLCTITELQTMAQRFYAAQLLDEGATYEEIAEKTGMSSATISRIKRFLNYGADGYRLAIERMPKLNDTHGDADDDVDERENTSRFE